MNNLLFELVDIHQLTCTHTHTHIFSEIADSMRRLDATRKQPNLSAALRSLEKSTSASTEAMEDLKAPMEFGFHGHAPQMPDPKVCWQIYLLPVCLPASLLFLGV